MLNQIALLAEGDMGGIGEVLLYVFLFFFLVWLACMLAVTWAVSVLVTRQARTRGEECGFFRVFSGAAAGGCLAAILTGVGTVPLGLADGGWFWLGGFPLIAGGVGAYLGASLVAHRTNKTVAITAIVAFLLLATMLLARTSLSRKYGRPPLDEAIQRIEAGDATVLRHLQTYPQQPILTALLASIDRFPNEPRRDAIYILGKIGRGDHRTLEKLQRMLAQAEGNGNWKETVAIIQALGIQGPLAVSSVPQLLDILRESSPYNNRYFAISALVKIDPDSPLLVPAFLNAAQDTDSGVRLEAVRALQELNPPAESVVPRLVKIFGQGDSMDRHYIGALLRHVDPTGEWTVPALNAELDSFPDDARREADRLLSNYSKAQQNSTEEKE